MSTSSANLQEPADQAPDLQSLLVQPSGGSKDPTLGHLCRALVCAELSKQVYTSRWQTRASTGQLDYDTFSYSEDSLQIAHQEPVPATFEAAFLDSIDTAARDGAGTVTCAIWHVKHIGFVAAFRGTAAVQDWVANLSISPCTVHCPQTGDSLQLHSGFYGRATAAASRLVELISREMTDGLIDTTLLLTGMQSITCFIQECPLRKNLRTARMYCITRS